MEIKIWQYEDSPAEYRFMYDDVDWVAFVPDSMTEIWNMINSKNIWEVTSRRFGNGTVYIQTH